MDTVRHIPCRPLWLFSGCLVLLLALIGQSRTRATSSKHTVPATGCKGNAHEESTCESHD
ncbi:MAG TPA: hypothetical protein VL485_09425 [Ktedonobacteraceae bacterium]|nr:hypothetical protein [Ktedonobacteraceae bacterium]